MNCSTRRGFPPTHVSPPEEARTPRKDRCGKVHRAPSHISKMVPPTIHLGPLAGIGGSPLFSVFLEEPEVPGVFRTGTAQLLELFQKGLGEYHRGGVPSGGLLMICLKS